MKNVLMLAALTLALVGCGKDEKAGTSCLPTKEAETRYYDTVYGKAAADNSWRKTYNDRCWCNNCGNISCESADGTVLVALWCADRCKPGTAYCSPPKPYVPTYQNGPAATSSASATTYSCWCEGDSAVCDEGQQKPLFRKHCSEYCSGGECN